MDSTPAGFTGTPIYRSPLPLPPGTVVTNPDPHRPFIHAQDHKSTKEQLVGGSKRPSNIAVVPMQTYGLYRAKKSGVYVYKIGYLMETDKWLLVDVDTLANFGALSNQELKDKFEKID